MAKSIVKANWLPEPLNGKELQNRLLQGEIESSATKRETADAQRYILAKNAQIRGRPAQILAELGDFESGPSAIQTELVFLRGFALSRLGRSQEANAIFRQLPKLFEPRILIEKGLEKLNRGEVVAAEAQFAEAFEKGRGDFDPYSACTLLGGRSLALIHQGDFAAAESCLRERKKILSEHPSETLTFGTRLYEILLFLERNEFDKASQLLAKTLGEVDRASVNTYFILHLKLRLHLAQNALGDAAEDLENLQATAKALNLNEGVLDFRLEEIELLLRRNETENARLKVEALRSDASRWRDQFLRFRLTVLNAILLIQNRESAGAIKEISQAIEVGEIQRYRPSMTWALFHAAGIASASGQKVQAKLFVNRGRKIANEIGLRVRLASFTYISEVLANRYAGGSALISLAKHPEIGPEIESILDAYRLLDLTSLSVVSHEKRENLAEPQLRRLLFKEPGLFWFQKEAVLLANKGDRQIELVEWPANSPLLAAFRLLWSRYLAGENGLKLQDLHKARSPHPYRAELHESAAKMLVSRLRDRLKKAEINLVYSRDHGRDQGRYELRSDLPAYTIQSGETKRKTTNRRDEILARIAMEPFVSTQTLCEEFKVTRQALHPFLSKLQKEGKIRVVKRGPVSGYVLKN